MYTNSYRYLFPFEKIPPKSRVLIYGAGFLGQEYLKQILITGYCRIIGFVDKNYVTYPPMIVPVYDPKKICTLDYDYIVIALRDGFGLTEIRNVLQKQSVPCDKIICILERSNTEPSLFLPRDSEQYDNMLAYEVGGITFSIYLAGGFGDMLYHKRFLMELVYLVPEAKIDIFSIQNISYLQWLYSDFPQVKNVIPDLGNRYAEKQKFYSLSISIFGPKFMQLDVFHREDFGEMHKGFAEKIEKLQSYLYAEGISHATPGAVAYYRRIYNGIDCYSWLNCGDIFSIKDRTVSIPFLKCFESEFRELGLKSYITFNTGNGSSEEGRKVAKAWPKERMQETLKMFRKKYPHVSIVQLGAENERKVSEADIALMGRNFGLVAFVLRGAMFHLDHEGGLVHLASQIGTKCIVLFGPTSSEYNAYPNNINIKCGTCHDCYGLYTTADVCARHMKEPECMYSITPEFVMGKIDVYMKERVKKHDF